MSQLMVITVFMLVISYQVSAAEETRPYYGQPVGELSRLQHGLKGVVYIVDPSRLRIRDFSYDGKGPAAFFWIGLKGSASPEPDSNGQKIPNEKGSSERLEKYNNDDITLVLPNSITADQVAWLSVWCEQFAVDFGHVIFPATVLVPKAVVLGQLVNSVHSLSSGNVTITDVRTIKIEKFKFDGLQNNVYFVIGNKSDSSDKYVKLLNNNEKAEPVGASSSGVDVVLTLPKTSNSSVAVVTNFQFIGVHAYTADNTLARVDIPSGLTVPPFVVQQKKAQTTNVNILSKVEGESPQQPNKTTAAVNGQGSKP